MAGRRTITAGAFMIAMGCGLAVAPGIASAVPAPGTPEGAVTFSAKDLGNCEAEFTIVNKTNVTTYTIDWRIDDEEGRDIGVGFPVWRTGNPNMASKAASPTWPEEVPENTTENRTLVSDREPVTAVYTQNLKNLNGWNPELLHPDADTHKVDYRIVLGPPGNNGQTADGTPEWLGDRQWRSITVTGCNPPAEGGSLGSLSSLDFLGSLGTLGALFDS